MANTSLKVKCQQAGQHKWKNLHIAHSDSTPKSFRFHRTSAVVSRKYLFELLFFMYFVDNNDDITHIAIGFLPHLG
jgi:hypothetical protein